VENYESAQEKTQRSDNGIVAPHPSASWLYVCRANIRNTQKKFLPYLGGNAKQGAAAGETFPKGEGRACFLARLPGKALWSRQSHGWKANAQARR